MTEFAYIYANDHAVTHTPLTANDHRTAQMRLRGINNKTKNAMTPAAHYWGNKILYFFYVKHIKKKKRNTHHPYLITTPVN